MSMGLGDLPFWGRMAAEAADAGLNKMGARRCAKVGHRWADARTVVLTEFSLPHRNDPGFDVERLARIR